MTVLHTHSNLDILCKLRAPVRAAMLFGSVARDTNSNRSDVDVLQLMASPSPSYAIGPLSVSVYTADALKELALQGSLFVLHLKTEGKILHDPERLLDECLKSYHP